MGLAVVALAAACGSSGSSGSSSGGGGSTSTVLTGAGSTLVAPLISQWEPDYVKSAGITITYGAVGSGGGIDAITNRTVDFGASDAPLSSDQATACKSCLQIPWALAATVVTYNVKGVPNNLKLTGPVLADIFSGQSSARNDSQIASLNPGVNLPSTHITPIYRSDGSGDSFVFTSYLSAVSSDWKSKVGASTQPAFPTGQGAEKNSGVTAAMQATDGAIGYVAVSYIAADSLNEALMQNAAGNYPEPTTKAITAAADAVTTIQPGRLGAAGEPAGIGRRRLPVVLLQLRDRPADLAEGHRLEGVPDLRHRPHRSGVRARLGFPPLPSAIVAHARR